VHGDCGFGLLCIAMLAFDIETTGLDKHVHCVTVVCFYGELRGKHFEKSFNFKRDGFDAHAEACIEVMRGADVLVAINGFRFDVPFLGHFLKVSDAEMLSWLVKLHDPCEVCFFFLYKSAKKLRIRGCVSVAGTRYVIPSLRQEMRVLYSRPMSLQRFACFFDLGFKSSSGVEAVLMAEEGRWDELESYCMQDARLTFLLAGKIKTCPLECILEHYTYI